MRTSLLALAALITLGGVVGFHEPARAVTHLTLRAGAGQGGFAVNAFLPETVTVEAGASLTWEFTWFEPHTVSFGTPDRFPITSTPSPTTYDGSAFVSSDVTFGPGKRYTVSFPKVGAYPYFCFIHPDHRGVVRVVAPGAAGVDTQPAADARAKAEYDAALGELEAIAASARAQPVEKTPLADGTTSHLVRIARETRYGDVQQFFPPTLTIATGDTVAWHTMAKTPHTVTFGPFPTGVPLPGNPLVDAVSRPADAYRGEGFWNSGPLGIDRESGLDFSIRFAKPGSYAYYCILHRDQGHVGTINVVDGAPVTPTPAPRPTPGPPATGSGGGPGPGGVSQTWSWLLALVAIAAGGTVSGWRLARRR
ncbi:MAG: plastocyanin/azurin family copper-binding protein [Dehalococcoidia bacterium]